MLYRAHATAVHGEGRVGPDLLQRQGQAVRGAHPPDGRRGGSAARHRPPHWQRAVLAVSYQAAGGREPHLLQGGGQVRSNVQRHREAERAH